MGISGFLGQALTDPATGLPNLPYFELVRDWECRRASRRSYSVRVLTLRVRGFVDRSLSWRLCQELRTSDLIASDGGKHYRVLLTSPDAENAPAIGERIQAMIDKLNEKLGADPMRAELAVEAGPSFDRCQGPWGPGMEPAQG